MLAQVPTTAINPSPPCARMLLAQVDPDFLRADHPASALILMVSGRFVCCGFAVLLESPQPNHGPPTSDHLGPTKFLIQGFFEFWDLYETSCGFFINFKTFPSPPRRSLQHVQHVLLSNSISWSGVPLLLLLLLLLHSLRSINTRRRRSIHLIRLAMAVTGRRQAQEVDRECDHTTEVLKPCRAEANLE